MNDNNRPQFPWTPTIDESFPIVKITDDFGAPTVWQVWNSAKFLSPFAAKLHQRQLARARGYDWLL
jgi:hypothetical protein